MFKNINLQQIQRFGEQLGETIQKVTEELKEHDAFGSDAGLDMQVGAEYGTFTDSISNRT